MPSWQSTDILDPNTLFSSFQGGGAAFDSDGDLLIDDTIGSGEFIGIFRNKLTDYQWLEIEVQNLNFSVGMDFTIYFLSDAEFSSFVAPRAFKQVHINEHSIRTFKVPFVGTVEGIRIGDINFLSGIKIKSFKVVSKNSKFVSVLDTNVTTNLAALGFIPDGAGNYSKLLGFGEVVNAEIDFVANVGKYARVKVSSNTGLGQIGFLYEGELFTCFGNQEVEVLFDTTLESSPLTVSLNAPTSGQQARVVITVIDAYFGTIFTGFGVGGNGLSPAAPQLPSQTSLLSSDNIWTGRQDYAGIVSFPGAGYLKAAGFGTPITYNATIPIADLALTKVSQLLNDSNFLTSTWIAAVDRGGAPEKVQQTGSPVLINNTFLTFKDGSVAAPNAATTLETPLIYIERHTNNPALAATTWSDWGNIRQQPAILVETIAYGAETGAPTGISVRTYSATPAPANSQPLQGIAVLAQTNAGAGNANRSVYAANFIASFPTGNKPVSLVGIEIDILPGTSSGTSGPWVGGSDSFIGCLLQSASANVVANTGVYVSEAFTTAGWQYGYAAYGHFKTNLAYLKNVEPTAAGQGIYVETAFVGSTGRVFQAAVNGTEKVRIDGNGILYALTTSNSLQIPVIIRNDQSGSGVAAIGFDVASSAGAETQVPKAGIGLIRTAAQGVGDLAVYVRSTTDVNAFTTADEALRILGASRRVLIGGTTDSGFSAKLQVFGAIEAQASVALTAGGVQAIQLGTAASGVGVFYGSGAPTIAASKGSIYLRSDGSATNNRAYINTDGGTTWTALTTAA